MSYDNTNVAFLKMRNSIRKTIEIVSLNLCSTKNSRNTNFNRLLVSCVVINSRNIVVIGIEQFLGLFNDLMCNLLSKRKKIQQYLQHV